jgi:O-antigen chain-terminating methyltransferase
MSERVVEVPWALSRYQGERRVLDIGPAYGHPVYLSYLNRLGAKSLHGVDLSSRAVNGLTMTRADVRRMPYRDRSFELIVCISTIEHIGRDNTRYQALGRTEPAGDVGALEEMRRVLDRAGRILITVPFGRLEYHDWFKQYDLDAWTRLVMQAGLVVDEQAVYAYSDAGWSLASMDSLPANGYGELAAPAATGVLCASLSDPT